MHEPDYIPIRAQPEDPLDLVQEATPRRLRRALLVITIWCGLIIWRLCSLIQFDTTPGARGRPLAEWPATTSLPLDVRPSRFTLLLFLHARCSCSHASLHELEQLLGPGSERVSPHIIVADPAGGGSPSGALWEQARALPGAVLHWDHAGIEAQRFGALTSGDVLLWDAQGRLLYRGGITPARGHIGDSPGPRAIRAFLQSDRTPAQDAPVFGCPISNPDPQTPSERSSHEHPSPIRHDAGL